MYENKGAEGLKGDSKWNPDSLFYQNLIPGLRDIVLWLNLKPWRSNTESDF